jgi:probable rRNA maturation factor
MSVKSKPRTGGPTVLLRADHPTGANAGRVLGRLARRYLRELGMAESEISILVVTDAQIKRLNRLWRKRDEATDVLSFPNEGPVPPGAGRCLGDVVISLDTARRRARSESQPIAKELALYLAHGLLHLLGHDHHRPREARRMARAERRLLGAAGLLGRPAATSRSRARPRE